MIDFDISNLRLMDDFDIDMKYSEEELRDIISQLTGNTVVADKGDLIEMLRSLINTGVVE